VILLEAGEIREGLLVLVILTRHQQGDAAIILSTNWVQTALPNNNQR